MAPVICQSGFVKVSRSEPRPFTVFAVELSALAQNVLIIIFIIKIDDEQIIRLI